jgi:hypothetical protein
MYRDAPRAPRTVLGALLRLLVLRARMDRPLVAVRRAAVRPARLFAAAPAFVRLSRAHSAALALGDPADRPFVGVLGHVRAGRCRLSLGPPDFETAWPHAFRDEVSGRPHLAAPRLAGALEQRGREAAGASEQLAGQGENSANHAANLAPASAVASPPH